MSLPLWKTALLNGYYHASRPWRAWYGRRAAAAGRLPLAVLFYHRVADDRATPWTLSTARFARHVDWLAARYELVSLEEIQRRMRQCESRRPAVSITFDDGYADNCREAIPLLVRRNIPCTYFVTLDNVLRGEPFAHDVAAGRRLAPNTLDELRAMAASGVEIGAHANTHGDLGAIADAELLEQEIAIPRQRLQDLLGRRVRYFAFPFGQPANISPAAVQTARRAGYEAVCSAAGGYNLPGGDDFQLARIHGDEDLARLRNWLTIDPRKLPRVPTCSPAETTPLKIAPYPASKP